MDSFLILEPLPSSGTHTIFRRVGLGLLRDFKDIFDSGVRQVINIV